MHADTLRDIRRRIERRSTESGRYRIACARTGDSPVPVTGLRFPSRDTACEAVQDARLYRSRLRSLELQTRWYDLIVHEIVQVDDVDGKRLLSTAFRTLIDSHERERE